ncbi:MAG: PAS domain S-box protein [Candidatus Aminicenantes bacterium]|nr:PAS domain S-box protein [Candidatus Aminicenantes bacterium]
MVKKKTLLVECEAEIAAGVKESLQKLGCRITPVEAGSEEALLSGKRKLTDLRLENKWFYIALHSIGDAVITTDTAACVTFMNAAAEILTGWREKEAVGKPIKEVFNIINEITGEAAKNPVDRVLREGVVVGLANDTVLVARDGSRCPIDDSGAPIKDDKGKMLGVVLVFRDVTERKRVEGALRRERDNAQKYLDIAEVMLVALNETGEITLINRKGCRILGYKEGELIGKNWFQACLPERIRGDVKSVFHELMEGKIEPVEYYENPVITKSGDERIIAFHNTNLEDETGKIMGTLSSGQDVTERNRKEKQIETALREKEVLLKEIHHRVKNNLQTISSLLSLQAKYIDDKRSLEVLENSRERVSAMALVHEKLYSSKDLSKIESREYICSLISHLFNVYIMKPGKVKIKREIEDIALDIETAIPLGLIINEFVSNTFKHAFPDERTGELMVKFAGIKDADYNFILVVSDNGVGLPQTQGIGKGGNFGMVIVNALVKQLHGVIEVDRDSGTTVTIKFKKLTYKKRI